ncbi:MAG: aminomethyl-transferring glycine dehydrogenase subunit GcvPB [Firmicutes bacterium]|nr:aminomethyl-transferring glycine dehydrogenase subunit GcvPB [Bacillota bacterium]
METIFEKSKKGKRCSSIKPLRVPTHTIKNKYTRGDLNLPEVAEIDLVRHYTALSNRAFGVDTGFYPLGSCTMKYNPKLNDEAANLPGFTQIHPSQEVETVQGCMEAMYMLSEQLMEITGMDGISLQPSSGAHGEYLGLLLIDAYHKSRKQTGRTKILIPDSAHGTNPASAAMAGFEVVVVPSNADKGVDIDALKALVGNDTAALMLTNPTTLGLFEKNIKEIGKIVHDAGGLLYYDGANLNAIMGIARPGDMGFDVIHLNIHKTFSTPHGGGGPGSGPVGVKTALFPFLPNPSIIKTKRSEFEFKFLESSIGKIGAYYGNFGVYIKALAYILTLGGDGLKESSVMAVTNANYLKKGIADLYPTEKGRHCMHEFVVSLEDLKAKTGVSAMDIAKAMIDRGMHPPTMYFPLIVHEALMIEPTETESKDTLDNAIKVLRELYELALSNPQALKNAPATTVISRPDEALAARQPKVRG